MSCHIIMRWLSYVGEALDPVVDQKDDDEQLEVEAPAETLPFQPHKRCELVGFDVFFPF